MIHRLQCQCGDCIVFYREGCGTGRCLKCREPIDEHAGVAVGAPRCPRMAA